jgi:Zn-dependent protease
MPLPPLDGGRILVSLLPHRYAYRVARVEPYGFPILLVLLFTGVLSLVLWPLVSAALWMVERGFSLPLIELIRIARAG